jgi:hypothetical protein
MRVPNRRQEVECAFHVAFPLSGALSGRNGYQRKGELFPSSGRNCDIIFPAKWKIVSTCTGNLIPDAGQLTGNPVGLSRSTFGIPIARLCAAD